jgi:hypothetical protein
MIPGQNLLNMALTVIAKQSITYYSVKARNINSVGQTVTWYNPGIVVLGSFQPVPRALYMVYGLDLQKDYYTFYASKNIIDLGRDATGDQIAFNGDRFQVESANDWYALDGWKGVLCVRVGADDQTPSVWGFNRKPAINNYVNFGNGNFFSDEE